MVAEILVAHGEALRSLGDGRIGGYLIRYGTPETRDLYDTWFTPDTFFGRNAGQGADVYFHHAIPVRDDLAHLALRTIGSGLEVRRDELGLWAETVLNLADAYERQIADLVAAGKLGWSSGAPGHLVRVAASGEITHWPIAEGSPTPAPAEPRNRLYSIRSLVAEAASETTAPVVRAAPRVRIISYHRTRNGGDV